MTEKEQLEWAKFHLTSIRDHFEILEEILAGGHLNRMALRELKNKIEETPPWAKSYAQQAQGKE